LSHRTAHIARHPEHLPRHLDERSQAQIYQQEDDGQDAKNDKQLQKFSPMQSFVIYTAHCPARGYPEASEV
jgi:hypothetical protein